MWVFSVPAELGHSNSVALAGGGRDYPELAPPHRPPSLEAPAHKSLHFLQKGWAGEGPDLSSKFQCAAKGWNQPRKPGVPSSYRCQGAPPPLPSWAGAHGAGPHAPEPFAGSRKGPASWRRSAGNQLGPWPAAPLPIQLAPSLQLPSQPLETEGEGARSPPYGPSSSRRDGEGGPGCSIASKLKARPKPSGRVGDKHLSHPPPHYGHPRASHSWMSGSRRRRELWRLVGDRWGVTSCAPLVL